MPKFELNKHLADLIHVLKKLSELHLFSNSLEINVSKSSEMGNKNNL